MELKMGQDVHNQNQMSNEQSIIDEQQQDEILRSESENSYDNFGASNITRSFSKQIDMNKNGLDGNMLEPIKELQSEIYQNHPNNDKDFSDQDMLSDNRNSSNNKEMIMSNGKMSSGNDQKQKNIGLQIYKQPSAHQIHQILMSSVDGSSQIDEIDSRKSSVDISDISRYLKIKQRKSRLSMISSNSFLDQTKGLRAAKEKQKDKNVRSFFEQVQKSSFVDQQQSNAVFQENYQKQSDFFVDDADPDPENDQQLEFNNAETSGHIQEEKPQIIKGKSKLSIFSSNKANFMSQPGESQEQINSMKMLNMANKKKNYCEICNETFKNESTFLKHIKSHVDFVCPLCDEHFRKEKTRDIHVSMKFCQDGIDDHEKQLFNETEKMNNFTKPGKKPEPNRNGAMSFLWPKKTDSKKKKENESILEEYILDSYLLQD